MNHITSTRWISPDTSTTIDYSVDVMEEIRALATEGFQQLARGGIEVGGILFGRRERNGISILACRPVPCTYARGPSYILSKPDKLLFVRTMESHRGSDPALKDMIPVGWFVSHIRNELSLSESDREIFASYFPHQWDVTMVLRRGRMGGMRAGFFVREADGRLRPDSSPAEFDVEPLRQSLENRAATPRSAPALLDKVTGLSPGESVATQSAVSEPAAVSSQTPATRRWRWLWPPALALAVISAFFGARIFLNSASTEPLSLQAREQQGEMRIEWNPASKTIQRAQRAVLELNDGATQRLVQLSADQLRSGGFPFLRNGTDLRARLVVYSPSGASVEEVARYLGQPLKPTPPAPAVEPHEDEINGLRQENERLKADLTKAQSRARSLENHIETLENFIRERDRSAGSGKK